jgi:hypothetical protein
MTACKIPVGRLSSFFPQIPIIRGRPVIEGTCRLCGETAALLNCHVWPRFAYKDFVSDRTKGGSFIDLKKGIPTNVQEKKPWFCTDCDQRRIGNAETYAAEFCRTLTKAPTSAHKYEGILQTFAVSISLRTAMLYMEGHRLARYSELKAACGVWKEFLLGRRKAGIMPYSQHLFVVFGEQVGWHRGLGGYPFVEAGLILSQVGPLFIVGLTNRRRHEKSDWRIWRRSEITLAGGSVEPISAWRVGGNITHAFGRVLHIHQTNTIERVAKRNARF